jgi:hypothetical protein
MKLLVKSSGRSCRGARGTAIWKTWKPHALRSADAEAAKRDSAEA